MKSQNTEILSMLKRGPVTPIMALNTVGCFRLAARIFDLKEQGYAIRTDMVGDDKKFAQYSLIGVGTG